MKIYEEVTKFRQRFPLTVGWRLKKHSAVIEMHLNPDEKALYVFFGQKNDVWYDIFCSCVVCLTNKRILIGQKKLLWGYSYSSITPDLFNDLSLRSRLIWGVATIDTLEEQVKISNIDKKALIEIETKISVYMINEKQKYLKRGK